MAAFVRDPVTGRRFRWVSRAEWGARSPRRRARLAGSSNGVFHHYSVTPRPRDLAEGMRWMRDIQAIHMAPPRGWFDFAYNLAVADHGGGTIYEGRGLGIANGAQRFGSTSHAVVRLGGQPNPGESVTADEIAAHIACLRLIHGAGFDATRVRPHNAVQATGCPGNPMADLIARGRFDVPLSGTATIPIQGEEMKGINIIRNDKGNRILAQTPAGVIYISANQKDAWRYHALDKGRELLARADYTLDDPTMALWARRVPSENRFKELYFL